jgi:CRISPR-associated protein Csc2
MFLPSLASIDVVFHSYIPELPMGKYAHIILLRETNSFALFQTDGELNTSRGSLGRHPENQALTTRIVLFKRKQSTPERLTGRELLRRYGLIHKCKYNTKDFCKRCPDCIFYGFAIGSEGSSRSRVLVDTAFSITGYDMSHQRLTFNAPSENGTMSEEGKMLNALNWQDYVLPQVYFPSVVTIKDPTEAEFIYVLNNILRTRRYGAQNTRTGTVENIITGIVFADGEIFSNLALTRAVYDHLSAEQRARTPLLREDVRGAMEAVVPALLREDAVVFQAFAGIPLETLLRETHQITTDEARLREVLTQANAEANRYAIEYGVGPVKEAPKEAKAGKTASGPGVATAGEGERGSEESQSGEGGV